MTGGMVIAGVGVIGVAIWAGVMERRSRRAIDSERRRFLAAVSDYEVAIRLRPHGQGVKATPADPSPNQRRPGSLVEVAGRVANGSSGDARDSTR